MTSSGQMDIHYMEVELIYKKGRSVVTRRTWMVSTYNTPNAIMSHDKEGMKRLSDRIFGNLKTRGEIVIRKVLTSKVVGTTSSSNGK